MEVLRKCLYEPPALGVIELKNEGIICESNPSFEEGFDED